MRPPAARTASSAGIAALPAISCRGTLARTSGSDQPSGSGLPGSWAVPTTISRARHTVLHSASTVETDVSSTVAVRGCSRCSASRAIGQAVSGRTRQEDEDSHVRSVVAGFQQLAQQPLVALGQRGDEAGQHRVPVLLAVQTRRIFSAARPASSAAGSQTKERPSRLRVTAFFASSLPRTVITVV